MKQHIPNILTISRIAVIPLFVGAFYLDAAQYGWLPLALFLYAAITDFFDGYLARKWQAESDIGRVLDPIADKLLVAAALLVFIDINLIEGPILTSCVVIIICRELFVSGLREALENKGVTIHVTKLAKWKTTMQMVAVIPPLLLIGVLGGKGMEEPLNVPEIVGAASLIGIIAFPYLIGMAALLTAITGIEYTIKGFRALKQ